MPDKKKIAAAMAAVNTYLEEEAASARPAPKPMSAVSMWQLSGRQEIMQMSSLWQRRIVPLR